MDANTSEKQAKNKIDIVAAYQFPKGQSGNSNGRPKGARNKKTIAKIIAPKAYSNLEKAHSIIKEQQEIVDSLRTAVTVNKKLSFTNENIVFAQTILNGYAKMTAAVETIAKLDGSLKDDSLVKSQQQREDHDNCYVYASGACLHNNCPDRFGEAVVAWYQARGQTVTLETLNFLQQRFDTARQEFTDWTPPKQLT